MTQKEVKKKRFQKETDTRAQSSSRNRRDKTGVCLFFLVSEDPPLCELEGDPLSEGGESCIQGAVWGRLASNGVVGATIADTFVFGAFFLAISL